MIKITVIGIAIILTALCGCSPEKETTAKTENNTKIEIINGPIPVNRASADNFSGEVYSTMLTLLREHLNLSSGYVNFTPGARTNWHTHPEGQMLIITSGKGRVQQWGEPLIEVKEGDLVWFPAGVKHWHGASPDESMTHLSMAPIIEGVSSVWLEPVTDEQYNRR